MKTVYGLNVEVEGRCVHHVEEEGQRVLLFEAVQDLLLDIAWRAKQTKVRVVITQENRHHIVQLEPEESINFETPAETMPGKRPFYYDVLERICERLYQVEGHLKIEPNLRRAKRITLMSEIEVT
jgi:solute:Na+ symporter, SSS family